MKLKKFIQRMSFAADLIDAYQNQLMKDDFVRYLCSQVPQNAALETIELEKCQDAVRNAILADSKQSPVARRAIMAWLNRVYWCHNEKPLPIKWWWEMHTRIHKLLVISMVLEGDNLRSFGVEKVEVSDIPQALFFIMKCISEYRFETFPQLKKTYENSIEYWTNQDSSHPQYLNLYLLK